jgi:hypothetical protein
LKKSILILALVFILLSFSVYSYGKDYNRLFHKYGLLYNDTLQELFFYFGVNWDYHLTRNLMITPEANLFVKPVCRIIYLEPAVVLNLKIKNAFVGAGVMRLFRVAGDTLVEDFTGLKINIGFRLGDMVLRIIHFSPFDDLFGDNWVGAQIGFEF